MEAYYCQTTPQSRKISGGDYGKGGRTRCRPQAREGRSGNEESYEGNLAESAKQFLKKVAHAGKMFLFS